MPEKTSAPSAGFKFRFHPRILGTPAPVFPGFEIDISDSVPEAEKQDAIWHRERVREMLRKYPKIRELTGNTPSTAIWCAVVALIHVGVAIAVGWQPIWVVIAAAFVLGALCNINLFNLAHECNHSMVFKGEPANRWLFTLTSLPMFLSGHHTWWIEHHVHHNDLGAKKDFIKRRRSFYLLTKTRGFFGLRSGPVYTVLTWLSTPLFFPYALIMLVMQVLRSAAGLCVYFFQCIWQRTLAPSKLALSILADEHLVSGYERYRIKHWAVIYPLLNFALTATVFAVGGWKSVLYLLLSALFFTGFLHPLMMGLILSNSHFHGHKKYQPSASYYGWINWITFNIGYHTEHHDFCSIPWSRLPKLRRIAPDYYDNLVQTKSYALLTLQFVFGSYENFDAEIYRNQAMLSEEEQKQDRDEEIPENQVMIPSG